MQLCDTLTFLNPSGTSGLVADTNSNFVVFRFRLSGAVNDSLNEGRQIIDLSEYFTFACASYRNYPSVPGFPLNSSPWPNSTSTTPPNWTRSLSKTLLAITFRFLLNPPLAPFIASAPVAARKSPSQPRSYHSASPSAAFTASAASAAKPLAGNSSLPGKTPDVIPRSAR